MSAYTDKLFCWYSAHLEGKRPSSVFAWVQRGDLDLGKVKDTSLGQRWSGGNGKYFSFIFPSAPSSTEPASCFHIAVHILYLYVSNAHSGNNYALILSSYVACNKSFKPLQEQTAQLLPFLVPCIFHFVSSTYSLKKIQSTCRTAPPTAYVLSLDGGKLREWVERNTGQGSLYQICRKIGFTC